VLLYNLTGDVESAARVRTGLDRLVTADQTADAYQLRMLAAHVDIILQSKPVLDGLVARMVEAPTSVAANTLELTYTRDYESALGWTTTFRLVLILLAIALAACIALVVVRLRRATQALQQQAHHDGLTSLPNRTLLHLRLEAGTQAGGPPAAMLLMDLNRFKEVNDTLGHHAGDELLRQVARRLLATLGATDTVARLGGDEFAMLLMDADVVAARTMATRILRALGEPFAIEGRMLEIGASIGIALVLERGDDAESLLRRADGALYVAKREQSGSVVYTPEHDQHGTKLRLIVPESELAAATAQ
jgi:diguanylate cyclase (GGDEF)-like protein